MVHTDVVIAINAPKTRSTTTRVVGAAIDAGGAVETKVVGAEVWRNVTRLACEPFLAMAHKVVQFVFASVAMTRVWVAVVSIDYKAQKMNVSAVSIRVCTSPKLKLNYSLL